MNNVKPRFNAQMEGTVLPLFDTRGPYKQVYFHGDDTWTIINSPNSVDTIQALCFKIRADLARIVAESRRK